MRAKQRLARRSFAARIGSRAGCNDTMGKLTSLATLRRDDQRATAALPSDRVAAVVVRSTESPAPSDGTVKARKSMMVGGAPPSYEGKGDLGRLAPFHGPA